MVVVRRDQLSDVLLRISSGLASKEIIDQSTYYVFRDGWVESYNDMVSVRAKFELGGITAAIPSQELSELLSKSKDEQLDFLISDDKTNLIINGVRFKANIRINPVITLPTIQSLKDPDIVWQELPSNFLQSLKLCLFSTSRDMSSGGLVCIHIKGNSIESCDNYRLTQCILEGSVFSRSVLLPYYVVQPLLTFPAKRIFLDSDGWVHFMDETGTILSCREFLSTYPDISGILSMESGGSIKFPADIGEVLDRANTLAEIELTGESTINVELKDGWINVSSKSPVGTFQERIRAKSSANIKFQINPKFLKEILLHLKEAEVAKDSSKMKFVGDGFIHILSLSSE